MKSMREIFQEWKVPENRQFNEYYGPHMMNE